MRSSPLAGPLFKILLNLFLLRTSAIQTSLIAFGLSSGSGANVFGEAEPLLYAMFLELEAVLKSCGLVEHEVVWSCIRILEEVSYALELNRDA